MFDLDGRVALITGAASGIGAATARVFANAGASVVLAWYPPDGHDVALVEKAITGGGGRCLVAEVDVRRTGTSTRPSQRAVSEFGSIDIVVANAGIARKVALEDLDDEAWSTVLDVDLNGAWRCFRAALPHMRRAGYGRLLATSSIAGTVQAWPAHAALHGGQGRAGRADQDARRRVRPGRDHRQRGRPGRDRHAAGQRPGQLARPGRGPGGGAEGPSCAGSGCRTTSRTCSSTWPASRRRT